MIKVENLFKIKQIPNSGIFSYGDGKKGSKKVNEDAVKLLARHKLVPPTNWYYSNFPEIKSRIV